MEPFPMEQEYDAPMHMPATLLEARCRTRRSGVSPIDVLDLSIAGCVFDRRTMPLEEGQRVLIRLPGLTFMGASVIWIEDDRAGLAFEQPLYPPVLEHILRPAGAQTGT